MILNNKKLKVKQNITSATNAQYIQVISERDADSDKRDSIVILVL